ncbi:sensor histidine kinase [Maridesulfovibrio sp. FT414]|uniref:sensor histidine kinase n=1 Tax=Maridesulfovibrio sp. FT414 TaxID=2979469 RepID=UPI003D80693E
MSRTSLAQLFQRKLILLILVPGLIMTAAIISIIGFSQLRLQEREIMQLSRSLSKNVGFYIDGAEDVLRSVVIMTGGGNLEGLHSAFAGFHKAFDRFERLILLDKNENIIAVAPHGIKGVDFPIRFKIPGKEKHVLSSPIISPHSGKLVAYISIPVEGGGRLVAELSLDALQNFIYSFLASHRIIILTDAYGNLIVHPDRNLVLTQANMGGIDLFKNDGTSGEARFYTTDGESYFGNMSVIPGIGWKLVVACSARYIFQPIIALGLVICLLNILIFVILLLILRTEFHTSVLRPMTSYIRKLSAVAKGEYPLGSSGESEILEFNELGAVFDSMSEKVRERERELFVSTEFYQSVLDSMPSALIWVDDGMVVRECNERALEIFGDGTKGIAPVRVEDFFSGQDEISMEVAKSIELRSSHRLERRRLRPGARELYEITIFPLIGSEKGGVVVRLDDVTSRVRMEEIMVQTEKMMSVGGLAAGMAHEINNPLGGILQGAQNLERKFHPDIKSNMEAAMKAGCSMESLQSYFQQRKVKPIIDGILESGSRAAKIVSNMLEFSRPGSATTGKVAITDLLETSLALAAKDYDLKKKYDFLHIRIERDYALDLPEINCSRTEIEQVFFNLFKNAAQAMSGNADSANVPVIRVVARRTGGGVAVEISDNGPGIPSDVRRRVFEPFFTTKPPGIGTGLGLSVSYFIITQNHGGTFVVDSAPGGGARFIISLPLEKTGRNPSE